MLNPMLAGPHLAALAELTRRARTSKLTTGRDVIESDTAVEALLWSSPDC